MNGLVIMLIGISLGCSNIISYKIFEHIKKSCKRREQINKLVESYIKGIENE